MTELTPRQWVVRTIYLQINVSLECAFANVTSAFLPVLYFLEIGNQHNDYKRCNSSVNFVFRVCNDFTITAPCLIELFALTEHVT